MKLRNLFLLGVWLWTSSLVAQTTAGSSEMEATVYAGVYKSSAGLRQRVWVDVH